MPLYDDFVWFLGDFETALDTLFDTLDVIFQRFFLKRFWVTDGTGGGPSPPPSETAVQVHSWSSI